MSSVAKLLHDYMLAKGEESSRASEKYESLRGFSKKDFGRDINLWVSWFLNCDEHCEKDKEYIKSAHRLYKIRSKFKPLEKNGMNTD